MRLFESSPKIKIAFCAILYDQMWPMWLYHTLALIVSQVPSFYKYQMLTCLSISKILVRISYKFIHYIDLRFCIAFNCFRHAIGALFPSHLGLIHAGAIVNRHHRHLSTPWGWVSPSVGHDLSIHIYNAYSSIICPGWGGHSPWKRVGVLDWRHETFTLRHSAEVLMGQ